MRTIKNIASFTALALSTTFVLGNSIGCSSDPASTPGDEQIGAPSRRSRPPNATIST